MMRKNANVDYFFGREDILSNLDSLWGKNSASLVTCRGRRRIGKSTLIEKFASRSGARFIKIEGARPQRRWTNEHELRSFAAQLREQTSDDGAMPVDWLNAFKRLSNQVSDERTVVLLDEVSWMAYYDDMFAATLKIAWDNLFKTHPKLVLVVCGSVSTWITENILENKAYYGRRSMDVVVPELPIRECVKFWRDRLGRTATREVLDVLSVTGGVPRYLEEINPSQTADENLRRMAFTSDSILRTDFDEMFSDVITRQPKFVARVLEALVERPMTVTEIARKLSVGKGGHVSDALNQLVESGLVARESARNPETGDDIRACRFRVSDNYTRFYLKCIRPAVRTIDDGSFAFTTLRQLEGWNAVAGLAFEALIIGHYRELLPQLHLSDSLVYSAAPYRKAGRRKGEGLQIDLLLQTRRSLCVVEVKRRRTISAGIVDEVAQKVSRLKHPSDSTVRAALVYDGSLAPTVPADGYFDAIVSFSQLAGMD